MSVFDGILKIIGKCLEFKFWSKIVVSHMQHYFVFLCRNHQ